MIHRPDCPTIESGNAADCTCPTPHENRPDATPAAPRPTHTLDAASIRAQDDAVRGVTIALDRALAVGVDRRRLILALVMADRELSLPGQRERADAMTLDGTLGTLDATRRAALQ